MEAINTSLELTLENKLGQIKVDLNCDLGHTINTKLNQIKVNLSTDLQNSIGSTLKNGMDDIVDSLGKRQDAFEAKSDLRFSKLNEKQKKIDNKCQERFDDFKKDLTRSQEESKIRFSDMEKQLTDLKHNLIHKVQFPPLHQKQQQNGPPILHCFPSLSFLCLQLTPLAYHPSPIMEMKGQRYVILFTMPNSLWG